MKKIAVFLILIFAVSGSFAQKKNGTVYNEHESINKTRGVWQAFVAGDVDTYKSYFADSIGYVRNGGQYNKIPNNNFGNNLNWWKENVDHVMVQDDSPAYPDAIEYTGGGLWVQDWIVLSGTHRESGINLDLHIHNLYSFDENGKIATIIQYFNDDVFEEIDNSALIRENGKVFISHPHIATVRKLVNAYCSEDLETMLKYYAPDARFSNMEGQWRESIDLEARKKQIQANFDGSENIRLTQIGYPDCIYYEEGNQYTVYSWWEFSYTESESGKKVIMPLMLTHIFSDDGKIGFESAFYSTNHMND